MFKSVNVFQMVVLVLILVGVVMIFMRQNNTCVMEQKEGFKTNSEDHLVTYKDYFKYPSHKGSSDNKYNFCRAGIKKGNCDIDEFRKQCGNHCPQSTNFTKPQYEIPKITKPPRFTIPQFEIPKIRWKRSSWR